MKPSHLRHEYDFRLRVNLRDYQRIMNLAHKRDAQPCPLIRELVRIGLAIVEQREVSPELKTKTSAQESLKNDDVFAQPGGAPRD